MICSAICPWPEATTSGAACSAASYFSATACCTSGEERRRLITCHAPVYAVITPLRCPAWILVVMDAWFYACTSIVNRFDVAGGSERSSGERRSEEHTSELQSPL